MANARHAYNNVFSDTKKKMRLLTELARDGLRTDKDILGKNIYHIVDSPKYSQDEVLMFLELQNALKKDKGNSHFFNFIYSDINKGVDKENARKKVDSKEKSTINIQPTIEESVIDSQNTPSEIPLNKPRRPVILTGDNDNY